MDPLVPILFGQSVLQHMLNSDGAEVSELGKCVPDLLGLFEAHPLNTGFVLSDNSARELYKKHFPPTIRVDAIERIVTELTRNYIVAEVDSLRKVGRLTVTQENATLGRLKKLAEAHTTDTARVEGTQEPVDEGDKVDKANEANEANEADEADDVDETKVSDGTETDASAGEKVEPAADAQAQEPDEESQEEVETGQDEGDDSAVKSEKESTKAESSPPRKTRKGTSQHAEPEEQPEAELREQRRLQKKFQTRAISLLNDLLSWRSSSFFAQPVTEDEYYEVVRAPTDLKTIKAQVKDGSINTTPALEQQVQLMFANAIMYNPWRSNISKWAREMQVEATSRLDLFKQFDLYRQASHSPVPEHAPKRRKKD